MQMTISAPHTIQLLMAATSMAARTAPHIRTTLPTTGTLSSGTILSAMLFLITMAMMLQPPQLLQEQFLNSTGSYSLAGRHTTAAMIGTLMQMGTRFPTALILTKMPMECPIGGTKMKATTVFSIQMTSKWEVPSICLSAVGLQETSEEDLSVVTAMQFHTTCHLTG